MGLALDVDLADLAGVSGAASGARGQSSDSDGEGHARAGFGVLHPSLGESIATLRANVKVGTHVFVEVDTSALHAYSVE